MSIEPVPTISTDLIRFAQEAGNIHAIAKGLATTRFVPKAMQGRPDEITGAILFGREIGVDPMTALQIVDIIEGKPSVSANGMRGLAMARGVQFRYDEQTDTRVVMSARGPGQDAWTTVTWTLDRARKMGLADKSNWKKMPQAMLVARATSELCRLVAANVLIGLPYSTEELKDLPHEKAPEPAAAETEAPKRTVRRQPLRAEVPIYEPAPPPMPPEETPPQDKPKEISSGEEPTIDPRVRRALMASFNDLDIKAREDRLAYATHVVGRDITSVNDLAPAEASRLLDHLKADLDQKAWVGDTTDEEPAA